MVHRREVDDREIVLGNQGDLYLNAMTWWDHGTGSVWTQPRGEAIAGPLRGARLDLVPSTLTTWEAWRTAHPDTLALDAAGRRAGFQLDSMLLAVELGDETAAIAVPALREAVLVRREVDDVPVVFVMIDDTWSVFAPGDRELRLRDGVLRADDSRAEWDVASGRPLNDEADGQALPRVPAFTIFESDYVAFWPDGRLIAP